MSFSSCQNLNGPIPQVSQCKSIAPLILIVTGMAVRIQSMKREFRTASRLSTWKTLRLINGISMSNRDSNHLLI